LKNYNRLKKYDLQPLFRYEPTSLSQLVGRRIVKG
jgi:hypothetical protein